MSASISPVLPEFDKLWNYSKPSETEAHFRKLLPQFEASGDKDLYLQLLTQIARSQGLQKKFSEAHKTLDVVKAELTAKAPCAEVRYFLERGRLFNSSKGAPKALPLFKQSYELAIQRKMDAFAVDAAHMMAIAEKDKARQLEWNLKALSLAENSKEPKAQEWLGSLYNNLGWTYHESGDFNQALILFKKAVSFREQRGDHEATRVAKWCVARTYRSLKRFEEALQIQVELEKELEKVGSKDGYVYEELAELYLVTGKTDLSKIYFGKAYQELSKDQGLQQTESQRLERMKKQSGRSATNT